MQVKRDSRGKCGIYLIRNIINGKVYIGASVNINTRLYQHIASLRVKNKHGSNDHFINSWHKYGEDNFVYIILEECSREELKEKEFLWMQKYNSTDPKFGFNKRMDLESGMITHPETSAKIRLKNNKRFSSQKKRDEQGNFFKEFWKNNPSKKEKMAQNLKATKQEKYKFIKLDEQENILKEYDTMEILLQENPTYKWQNIYSVCNGYKKRIYGFKWKKILK